MRESSRWTIAVLVLAIAVLLPVPAAALSYVMMSDEALFEQAQGVAKFEVVEELPAADGDRETRYRLRTTARLAGRSVATYETLVLPGTFGAPRMNLRIDGIPRLHAGQNILLFHVRRADGALGALHLTLGLFAQTGAEKHGRNAGTYVRYLTADGDFGAGKRARYAAPRSVAGFEAWLRARGRGVRAPADYLLDSPVDAEKFTLLESRFSGLPGRWFDFDDGQAVPWTAGAEGQLNMGNDEFAALQRALDVWTNDPGSRIQLRYAGTARGWTTAQSGHVAWNDPDGDIAGTYDCTYGGVIAIGGAAYVQEIVFAGQRWHSAYLGRVIVQDGADCLLDRFRGANMAELLFHEIGHALGFGHACGDYGAQECSTSALLDDAAMRAYFHGDGRGASLRADDAAAAAFVYPNELPTLIFRDGFDQDASSKARNTVRR